MAHLSRSKSFVTYGDRPRRTTPQTQRTPDDAAAQALDELRSVVYFVAAHGLVKIGYTSNLRNRLATYGVERAALMAVIPGGRTEERAHHQRFAPDLARGREWFRPSAELMTYINDLRANAGVGPVLPSRFAD
jgi:hypothetical protein